ncbi:MAG: hypothetical protein ACLUI3_14470 [Christensenellales bacterium]
MGDLLINLTVMTLTLVAGLGFPVWQDLQTACAGKTAPAHGPCSR